MKKYSPSHEWIQIDGEIGTVGITKYAQEELGEIVYVQLPTLGKKISTGEEVAVLESTKAAADIYAPVSGEIVEVNTSLQENVSSLNKDPEQEGWLFKILLSNQEESILLNHDQYQEMICS